MKKSKKLTIKVKDTNIELTESELNFYLSETNRKKIQKNGVEKFFNNLLNRFNTNV